MVLHDHQANPHVHISVRAESKHGKRLNPRKADLHRWRETFAEKLRGWGIEAEATRQATRGVDRNYPSLWRKKAAEEGRERKPRPERKSGSNATASRREAGAAWAHIAAPCGAPPIRRTGPRQLRSSGGRQGGRLPASSTKSPPIAKRRASSTGRTR